MRQLLEFSNEPITISSARDHKLIEVNAAFLERTGYTREEVIGRSSLELGLWEDDSAYAAIGKELNATGAVRHRTIKYRSKNGELGVGNFSAAIRRFSGQPCVISFISDTTESVRAQAELRRNERRFRSYIEYASDGLTVFNRDGQITFAAPSVERLLGFSPKQVVGINYREFVHPVDLPMVISAMEALVTSDREPLTFRVRHRSGRWIFIEGIASMMPPSHDDPEQTVFNWRDVTQRKLDEERLRKVERRVRDIISHAPVVVTEFDADGIMTMAEGDAIPSDALGVEGIGKSMFDLFVGSREIIDALHGVLRGETVSTTAELSGRWFDVWGQPVRDSDGRVNGGIAVSTDITSRVLSEQNLKREKEQFRVLVDNSSNIVVMLSREGSLLFVSPSVKQQTGYEVTEMVGRDAFELIHPDDVASVIHAAGNSFTAPDSAFSVRFRVRCKNGEWRRFEAKGKVLPNQPDRMIIEERDVTEQEEYETELANARDAALESSRLKSAFLANMSHEIRTPLNVVLGYIDVIGDHLAESGDDTQQEYLEAAARSGKRLIQTINGILDYSKIEAGGFTSKPELLDLSDLVARQVEDFRKLASPKGLNIRFVDEEPNTRIMADEYCISAAVQNLIGNAIKFTEQGSIEVRKFRHQGELRLEVRDTGIGIDRKFLAKLFEPFVQEESGFSRKFEGSGLGLALTKRFLDANRARITVTSEKGAGATFTIHFSTKSEIRNVEAGDRVAAAPPSLPKILLVEDDPDTQAMMPTMLRNLFEVRVAASGDAVRKFVADDSSIEAILMDISVRGEEDGLQITRFLRSQPRFRSIPIIAVTAHASVEHQRMALDAGCDAVLTKPVTRIEILAALSQAMHPAAIRTPRS
jgi:PAS domain S-box-containing protein